ncbi:unnamed protein product [Ectocarpus sp. CCAP 1310/34]|nr:unnamed protein product [Ectocarpus sp. CCAP 1310/34]
MPTGRVNPATTSHGFHFAKIWDTDTDILGCAIEKYPELVQVCNNLLPEDAQQEDDGTREGDGSTGGAERLTAAKREGARLDEQNRRGTKQKKKGAGRAWQRPRPLP